MAVMELKLRYYPAHEAYAYLVLNYDAYAQVPGTPGYPGTILSKYDCVFLLQYPGYIPVCIICILSIRILNYLAPGAKYY